MRTDHTPSFRQLYSRSRLGIDPNDSDDQELEQDASTPETDEGKRRKKWRANQRERFVVAALAMCLEHDCCFKRWFLREVCEVRDKLVDSELDKWQIEVEPRRSADLRLENKSTGRLCVIECKTGAKLEEIQNPTDEKFWEDGGYGKLNSSQRQTHYVTLGANEVWNDDKAEQNAQAAQARWTFGRKDWCDLVPPERKALHPLTEDFFRLLCFFKIPKMLTAMNPNALLHELSASVSAIGDACFILNAVANKLNLNLKHTRIAAVSRRVEEKDNTGWWFGMEILRPSQPESANYKLAEFVGAKDGDRKVAWFGFAADSDIEKPQPCVWFYCKDEDSDKCEAKLASLDAVPEMDFTKDGDSLAVRCVKDSKLAPGEWMLGVLQAAIEVSATKNNGE